MRVKDYDYSEDEEIEDNRQSVQKILKKHFKDIDNDKEIKKNKYEKRRIKSY